MNVSPDESVLRQKLRRTKRQYLYRAKETMRLKRLRRMANKDHIQYRLWCVKTSCRSIRAAAIEYFDLTTGLYLRHFGYGRHSCRWIRNLIDRSGFRDRKMLNEHRYGKNTCYSCGAIMASQTSDGPISDCDQYGDALEVNFIGSYGMFIDPEFLRDEYGPPHVVICQQCAMDLCEQIPWITRLLKDFR